jgi:GDP-L-fucose synthase
MNMNSAPFFELRGRRAWVAGHKGLVGSAIVRRLQAEKCEVLCVDRSEVDLRRQADVEGWMERQRPHAIFLAAAKVGGILANDTQPGQFLYDNLAIQTNILETARKIGVAKVLTLGSACIYPRLAERPIREEALLSGPLEPTNQWYAISKIAAIKLTQAYRREYGCDFIAAMPTNLYGPGDNFDPKGSHVLPALIRKADHAKHAGAASFTIWGDGSPRREFLHADDCADALVFLMQHYSGEDHINVGSGEDICILDLAHIVARAVGFSGEVLTDPTRPGGAPARLMSTEKLDALGWRRRIGLAEGVAETYRWYLEYRDVLRSGAG